MIKSSVYGAFGRIAGSSAAGLLGQVINIAYKLILPPLFLHAWGIGIYGDWLLISSLTAYISLIDIGGGQYIANRLNQLYSSSNFSAFKLCAQTSLTIFCAIPAALFLIFLLAVLLSPETIWQAFRNIESPEIRLVAVVLGLQISMTIPQLLIFGIYRAIGQMARGIMMANGILTFQLLGLSGALLLRLGPIEVAILQFLPIPLFAVAALLDLQMRIPQVSLVSHWQFSKSDARSMLKPSGYFFLIQLSQIFGVHGTLIIAGITLGNLALVAFATVRTLANLLKSVLGVLINAAWPEITRLDSQQESTKLSLLFHTILSANLFVAIAIGVAMSMFGELVYTVWLQGKIDYNSQLMSLIVILLIQQTASSSFASLLMATNNHRNLAILSLASAIASVCLAYLGAVHFGLEGLVLGLIIGEFALLIGAPILVFRTFPYLHRRKSLIELLLLLLVPPAVTFPEFGFVLASILGIRFAKILSGVLRNGQ